MEFRCAIIGLGRIGCGFDDDPNKKTISTHAGAYSANKRTIIACLSDINNLKLKKYGEKYNVSSLYLDYHEMFSKEKLDCISICTLADSHLEIVREAAIHGVKGIFLEKPISDSLDSASQIIRICKEKKIRLQIDHQRRFDSFYEKIKELISNDKFGRIQHVRIYYGSGIANTGSHIFDLIRYFFGDIDWVEGTFSKNESNNPNDPNIDGKVSCKSDVICHLFGFDVKQYGILEFDILGTNARIRINLSKSTIEYFEVSSTKGLVYGELEPRSISLPERKDSIVLGLENLLVSIEKDTKTLSTGEDGYASLEAIIGMRVSAENNGMRINLPVKTNTYKIASK